MNKKNVYVFTLINMGISVNIRIYVVTKNKFTYTEIFQSQSRLTL